MPTTNPDLTSVLLTKLDQVPLFEDVAIDAEQLSTEQIDILRSTLSGLREILSQTNEGTPDSLFASVKFAVLSDDGRLELRTPYLGNRPTSINESDFSDNYLTLSGIVSMVTALSRLFSLPAFDSTPQAAVNLMRSWGVVSTVETNEGTLTVIDENLIRQHLSEIQTQLVSVQSEFASRITSSQVAEQEKKSEADEHPALAGLAAGLSTAAAVSAREVTTAVVPEVGVETESVTTAAVVSQAPPAAELARRQAISYESLWLTNAVLFDLCRQHGIAPSQQVMDLLRQETFRMLEGSTQADLRNMFANPAQRVVRLQELQERLTQSIPFVQALRSTYDLHIAEVGPEEGKEFADKVNYKPNESMFAIALDPQVLGSDQPETSILNALAPITRGSDTFESLDSANIGSILTSIALGVGGNRFESYIAHLSNEELARLLAPNADNSDLSELTKQIGPHRSEIVEILKSYGQMTIYRTTAQTGIDNIATIGALTKGLGLAAAEQPSAPQLTLFRQVMEAHGEEVAVAALADEHPLTSSQKALKELEKQMQKTWPALPEEVQILLYSSLGIDVESNRALDGSLNFDKRLIGVSIPEAFYHSRLLQEKLEKFKAELVAQGNLPSQEKVNQVIKALGPILSQEKANALRAEWQIQVSAQLDAEQQRGVETALAHKQTTHLAQVSATYPTHNLSDPTELAAAIVILEKTQQQSQDRADRIQTEHLQQQIVVQEEIYALAQKATTQFELPDTGSTPTPPASDLTPIVALLNSTFQQFAVEYPNLHLQDPNVRKTIAEGLKIKQLSAKNKPDQNESDKKTTKLNQNNLKKLKNSLSPEEQIQLTEVVTSLTQLIQSYTAQYPELQNPALVVFIVSGLPITSLSSQIHHQPIGTDEGLRTSIVPQRILHEIESQSLPTEEASDEEFFRQHTKRNEWLETLYLQQLQLMAAQGKDVLTETAPPIEVGQSDQEGSGVKSRQLYPIIAPTPQYIDDAMEYFNQDLESGSRFRRLSNLRQRKKTINRAKVATQALEKVTTKKVEDKALDTTIGKAGRFVGGPVGSFVVKSITMLRSKEGRKKLGVLLASLGGLALLSKGWSLIGGLVGGAVGFLIGGPIGAVIVGALGTVAGGLIGILTSGSPAASLSSFFQQLGQQISGQVPVQSGPGAVPASGHLSPQPISQSQTLSSQPFSSHPAPGQPISPHPASGSSAPGQPAPPGQPITSQPASSWTGQATSPQSATPNPIQGPNQAPATATSAVVPPIAAATVGLAALGGLGSAATFMPVVSIGALMFISLYTLYTIFAAFLAPIPVGTSTSVRDGSGNQYLTLKKTVSPNQIPNIVIGRPTTVTYTILISPKPGYTIKLLEATDTMKSLPTAPRPPEKRAVWTSPLGTPYITKDLFAPLSPEGLITNQAQAQYPIQFTDGVDALVTNTVTIKYDVFKITGELVVSNQSFTDYSSLRIGSPKVMCWPTTGPITQLPCAPPWSENRSHCDYRENAYDIGTNSSTFPDVFAPIDGTAMKADIDDLFGLHVSLKLNMPSDGAPAELVFAHLSEVDPSISRTAYTAVFAGTRLGRMGSTGNSSNPHLHYVIRPRDLDFSELLPGGIEPRVGELVQTCYGN